MRLITSPGLIVTAVCVLGIGVTSSVVRAESSAEVLSKVQSSLAELDGLTLRMTGERTWGDATHKIEGVLVYSKPNRFVARVKQQGASGPAWERLVSNGEKLYRIDAGSKRPSVRETVDHASDPTVVGLSKLPSPLLAFLVDSDAEPKDPDSPLMFPMQKEASVKMLGDQPCRVAHVLLDSPNGMIYADMYAAGDPLLIRRVTLKGELMVERPKGDGVWVEEVEMKAEYDFAYSNVDRAVPRKVFTMENAQAAEAIAYKVLPDPEPQREAAAAPRPAGGDPQAEAKAGYEAEAEAGDQRVHPLYGLYVAFHFDTITNTMSVSNLTIFPDGTAYAGRAPGWDTLAFNRERLPKDRKAIGRAKLDGKKLSIRWPDGEVDRGTLYPKKHGRASISFSPPRAGYYHAYIKATPFPRDFKMDKKLSRAFGGAHGPNVAAASGTSITFQPNGRFETESFSSAIAIAGIQTKRSATRDAKSGKYRFDGYRVLLTGDNGQTAAFRCYGLEYDDDEAGPDAIWIQGFGMVY